MPQIGVKHINQPVEIEIEMLKSRVESLEIHSRWLDKTWVDWTKSTKDMGQKIMIALEQIIGAKH